jgi:hypothetical protein
MLTQQPSVRPLADSELPSTVFAQHAWQGVSGRYSFINTGDVVHALAQEGIRPYMCKTSVARIESKRGYTKHMLRFRKDGALPLVGGVFPEVVIVNSHDTGSAFGADLGLYRLICKNGMVAQFGNMARYRGIHVSLSIDAVLEAVHSIMAQFPRVAETVQIMQTKTLGQTQREHFAYAAAMLRWESDKMPFNSTMLLSTRREEDQEPTLWNVFNTIQENLLTGQRIRTYGPSHYGYRRVTRSTRAVRSIDMDMKLNNGLWEIASKFATATA